MYTTSFLNRALLLVLLLVGGNIPGWNVAHAQRLVSPAPGSLSPGSPSVAPDQIIVRFRKNASQGAIQSLNAAHGARPLKAHPRSGLRRLAVPAGANPGQILATYRRHPLVEEAGLNFTIRALEVPNDTNFSFQWHLQDTVGGMWAEGVWDLSTTQGQGVVVAIIDTGVAYANVAPFAQAPDFQQKSFVSPWDFFNNDAYPNDDHGHGTHVAGTIAQDTNTVPPYGVAGVAYNSAIMPLKVLNYDGSGSGDDLVEAITYAVQHGADVINMSLGFPDTGSLDPNGQPCTEIVGLNAALQAAYNQGVVVVAAAGNDGGTTVLCPAAYPTVIAVGATRFDGQTTSYSNSGATLDVTAPGGDSSVDQDGDGYTDGILQETFCYDATTLWLYYNFFGLNLYGEFCDVFYSGTSMAAPHVAGTAALLLGENLALTPDQVRCYLESTARDRGPLGWDSNYGWGALEARAALSALLTPGTVACTSPPPPPPPPPPSGDGPPTITGFTPTIGAPGTAVTITGTNYEPHLSYNTVRFNARQAVVNSATATTISTSVPSGAISGRISVTTPAGQAVSSSDFFVPPSPYTATDVEFAERMAIGETKTVTINTANKIGLVLFDGVAGQYLGLGVTNVGYPNGEIVIYKPDGGILLAQSNFTTSGVGLNVPQLPITGTYTIQVNPWTTNVGSVTLTLSEDLAGTIVVDQSSLPVTIPNVGQRARVTFSGTAGQWVSVGMTNVTIGTSPTNSYTAYLYKPDGTLLISSAFGRNGGALNAQLPVAGSYAIVIDPVGTATGDITLTLSTEVTGAIEIDTATVSLSITRPGQRARVTFSGAAGQWVNVGMTGVTIGTSAGNSYTAYLYKPDGTVLASGTFGTSGGALNAQLPVNGTYAVVIDPLGTATGNITLTLSAEVTSTIEIDATAVSMSITRAGQRARAVFSGAAGQWVSVGMTNVTIGTAATNTYTAYLYKPDGTVLTSGTFGTNGGALNAQLPVNGTYTIVIDPVGTAIGNITLILSAEVTDTIGIDAAAVNVSITRPGQRARVAFSGVAGQWVSVGMSGVTIGTSPTNSYTVYLYKPDGMLLISSAFGKNGGALNAQLPVAGSYAIVIDPAGTAIGDITFTLSGDLIGTLTVNGTATPVIITRLGQNARLTFSGTANQQVTVRVTNNTIGSTTVKLLRSNNSLLKSATSSSASFNLAAQTLPTTDTYTVLIDPSVVNTGSINVSVTSP